MLKGNIKNKTGFTIIEVVLVLAIAGLIFLMVFIALPALQSSQRNTQRENDLSRFITAVTDYASNNNGRIPFTTGAGGFTESKNFVARYIDSTCTRDATSSTSGFDCTADQFRDPDGTLYRFTAANVNPTTLEVTGLPNAVDHNVYVAVGYMCGANEGTVIKGTGERQVAILMVLEGGGITCNANS
jgi:prepilin-type N-terminal cleavage/methylation domain-containing protein